MSFQVLVVVIAGNQQLSFLRLLLSAFLSLFDLLQALFLSFCLSVDDDVNVVFFFVAAVLSLVREREREREKSAFERERETDLDGEEVERSFSLWEERSLGAVLVLVVGRPTGLYTHIYITYTHPPT